MLGAAGGGDVDEAGVGSAVGVDVREPQGTAPARPGVSDVAETGKSPRHASRQAAVATHP
jgi:hypothetical protein